MKNILFNTQMTKAILDGRKVQTRRVVKLPDCKWSNGKKTKVQICGEFEEDNFLDNTKDRKLQLSGLGDIEDYYVKDFIEQFSKYQIGETIWVREPATVWALTNNRDLHFSYNADNVAMTIPLPQRFYDKDNNTPKWTDGHENGRGIPNGCIKEMARILLKVTNVRVERLLDISYSDLVKEGMECDWSSPKHDRENELFKNYLSYFKSVPRESYVLVYEFARVEK